MPRQVIIRTSSASELAAAARNAVVAFEVDDFDAAGRTGWSAVIVGHARVLSANGDLAHVRGLPLPRWSPTAQDHFIAITPELVSGRRLPEAA
jgi:uncharacterized protein